MTSAAASPPRLSTLILLSALAVLPVSMFLPSLPSIAREFQAGYALATLSVAGYAGIAAVLQLVVGPLSDRCGRRPVLLAALVAFVLASLGCALASDVRAFLLFRLLQGVVIAGYTVSLAVIRDTAPEQEAASLMGYVAAAWAAAPLLGPTFGGVLDGLFGWRSSFWALAALGAAVLAVCWVDLRETNPAAPSGTVAQPFRAYPELLQSRRFWAYALCMAFSTGAFYAFLGGAPLAVEAAFALSPPALGLGMGSTTAGFMLGSFLSGRYAQRYPLTTTMIAGRLVTCGGLALGLALLLAKVVHLLSFFGPCVLVGLGNGLTIPSANAGAMSVRPGLAGSAAGLSGALTVAGGAAVAAVTGAVVTEANGAAALFGVMLLSSLAGLVAVLWVLQLERGERQGKPTWWCGADR